MSMLYDAVKAAHAARIAVKGAKSHSELLEAGSKIEVALDKISAVYEGDQWHPRAILQEAVTLQHDKLEGNSQ